MPTNPCHKKIINLLQSQEGGLSRLYSIYADDLSKVLNKYQKKSNTNTWKGNKRIEAEVDKILIDFQNEMSNYISLNEDTGWSMSNDCNDTLVNSYIKGVDVKNAEQYFSRNIEALNAFKKRKVNGLNLSDRVWNLTYQTKGQLETLLESQVLEGRSASKIATDIKQYLVEPDRRYRRVRDKNGKLVYSSPGADYHPGQGVYRSSFKNALRLARNETNIAYRSADNERRQQLDFVTGIQVNLSNAHPRYDICDELQGRYPKNFVFVGWHPQCLCFTTNVLLSQKEFIEYVNGGNIRQQRYIRTIPKRAENYLNDNSEQIKGWKNKPYFIRDNFKNTKGGFAVKKSIITI